MDSGIPKYPQIRTRRSRDGGSGSGGQQQHQVAYPPIVSAASAAGGTNDVSLFNSTALQQPSGVTANISLASGAQLYESPKAVSSVFQRHGFQTSVGGLPPPDIGILVASSQSGDANADADLSVKRCRDQPRTTSHSGAKPLRKDASWFALMAALFYAAVVVYYLAVRIRFTLDMKDRWYSIIVLVVEVIGISSVLPYAAINVVHTHPAGNTTGLPAIEEGATMPVKRFALRVLVPCYKESLETVSATITAAMDAHLPPGVTRSLYLCDDGNSPDKRAWLEQAYGDGRRGQAVYVTGRKRAKGEINGKSANLNNALKNHVYPGVQADSIPKDEVIVVFDADMQACPNFFCRILEVMVDDATSLCLTPQAFHNVNPAVDIYNNSNEQFWQYVLPGLDAMGYIACTGTNFCIRAFALASVGWFPDFCITEDYALSMELKAAGFKGAYLAEYLAKGEAPQELRNILRQRSRWAKGHMQVFFSSRNPLLRWKLPLLQKLLYNNGTWSYFCTVITTWTFILVPWVSLMFQIQPVLFGREFALAATLYLGANFLVQNYFHVAEHMRGIWMAGISNYLLSFTYAKAITNTLLAKLHVKKKAGFKATAKTGAGTTATLQAALMTRLSSLTRRFNAATLPQLYPPQAASAGRQADDDEECVPDKIFMFLCLSICLNTLSLGLHQVYVDRAFTAWLVLPMLWAIYNCVPPLLFFGFLFASTNSLHNICFWLQLVQIMCGLGAIVCLWFVVPVVY